MNAFTMSAIESDGNCHRIKYVGELKTHTATVAIYIVTVEAGHRMPYQKGQKLCNPQCPHSVFNNHNHQMHIYDYNDEFVFIGNAENESSLLVVLLAFPKVVHNTTCRCHNQHGEHPAVKTYLLQSPS